MKKKQEQNKVKKPLMRELLDKFLDDPIQSSAYVFGALIFLVFLLKSGKIILWMF
jgi:hypothetical protein